ncbi:hypothetical protein K1719_016207 [Acacia pycnantha]|nr:hypothetical protein K1719_016207 [Acacia pycnantha]
MLSMMHMLGTFLAPTSSTTPAEKLLKVLASTINGFARSIGPHTLPRTSKKSSRLRECDKRKQQLQLLCWRVHIHVVGEEGDGDHHDDGESGYDDDKAPRTPIHIDESDGGSPIGEGRTKGEQSIVPYQVHQQYAPRRSHRPKMAKNMSPWTLTKPVKRPRKAKEEKAIFFDLISGSCTNEESEQ